MRVAFYDKLHIDRPDLYATVADVVYCTRFRPHTKLQPPPDLVLTTFSYVPDSGVPVVTLLSSLRKTSNLRRSPVRQAAGWSTHDTAGYALRALVQRYDGRPVLVVGRGRVGKRIARWLRRYRFAYDVCGESGLWAGLAEYGTVILCGRGAKDALRWYLPYTKDAHVINVADPSMAPIESVVVALALGQVRWYTVDGGPKVERDCVTWTPRKAWDGHHARHARPAQVMKVLAGA